MPGVAAIGAMEDADVGPGEDAVTAWDSAATPAVIICINQNLEDRNVGQPGGTLNDRTIGDAVPVGLSPGLTEIHRLVDMPNFRVRGKSGKRQIGHVRVMRIGCDGG